MQRLLAIALLTWKAAFRFRLFWVLCSLLLLSVVALPLLIKDDGTARGFTQIILTYTLSLITVLLGFSTLWLACGTLARDIEDCQMQMVAVKPVARWQIWLGKWLGLMLLNAALLAISGGSVYGLMLYRARHLPPQQQVVLRQQIFIARTAVKPPLPDVAKMVEDAMRARLAETPVPAERQPLFRKRLREQFEAQSQIVPPQYLRRWTIDLGGRRERLRDQPLYLRYKFFAANDRPGALYQGQWQVGSAPKTPLWRQPVRAPASSVQELEIPPNLFESNGQLTLEFSNYSETALLFPLNDGIEVLYREGGFGLNYLRGLCILLAWLAVLAALGLAAASFLSFPVAAFVSASLLLVALASGTLASAVEQGGIGGEDHETGQVQRTLVDTVMLPVFRVILAVVGLVRSFSPVDALSSGRSITWGDLARVWLQGVVLLGGVLAVFGMIALTRRELATAQGQA